MTDDLPEQFVLQRASQSTVYHTTNCVSMARADREPEPISDAKLAWHELPLCRYCDPDTDVKSQRGGVADD